MTLAAMLIGPPTAIADGELPLGGGASIVVDGTYCTLATIGHDNAGVLVGFTAAHCGGVGAQVVAEGAENRGTLGSVVAANGDLYYAVIAFDPAKVTPIPDFAGFAIHGIGPAPGFGQPACTQGGATGFGCGRIKFAGRVNVSAVVPAWQPGDDGAPVTVDGQLVGMTHRSWIGFPGVAVPVATTYISAVLFSTILDDLNASGGPGAGFTPAPA